MKYLPINALFIGVSDISVRLFSFIAVTYLARALGPANIGALAIGMAILTYATVISNMGLPMLGVRSVAAKTDSIQNLVKRICSAQLLFSIITFSIGAGILFLYIEEWSIRIVAIIYLSTLFPSALMLEWLFQGLNKMKILSIGQIFGMAVYLLFVIGLVSNAADIYWVPFAWCFGLLIKTIYFWTRYKKLNSRGNVNKQPLHLLGIIKQGIPLGIASLISQVVIQFPFIYLGCFDTTENTGLYSVAFRVVVLMLVIDRVFYTLFFPAVSRSFKDSMENLKERVSWTLKIVTGGSLYIAMLAFIAGRDLLPVIFGSEFRDSGLIFQALLGYFVLTIINSVFTFTLIGIKKERLYTKSLLIGAIAFVTILFLPLPLPATLMAPIALAIQQIVSMLMMMKYLRQSILTNLFPRVFLALSVTIIFVIFVILWQHLYPLFVSVIAAVFALPIITVASGINRRDLIILKGFIN